MQLPDISLPTVKDNSSQRLIVLGVGGILLIVLVQFVLLPCVTYVRSLDRDIVRAKREYASVQQLVDRLRVLQRAESVAVKAASGEKDALFAHVEQLARRFGLQRNLESMRPSSRQIDDATVEDEVTMRFRGATQKQLLQMLYAVEYQEVGLAVKTLGLRKDKKRLLDIDLSVTLQRPAL